MIVMKFGGTSVSSKKNIEQIKSILNQKEENYIARMFYVVIVTIPDGGMAIF